ncbi:hypothetical protein [Pontibacter russatus]|uniref:hypothetical protein n=1 Tax=Pontibacter russatus TaxID=2694929 RepID=UPI00137A0592|nr:hypothetical protein [Pontibacter russatus]
MKNNLYKLLFAFCLLTGASCGQSSQEEVETTEETATPDASGTEDTSSASNEVPASLQQH